MPIDDVELLRAACCIAAMDREVSDRESKALATLRERAGVGQASFDAMLDAAQNEPDFFEKQFRYVSTDPERTITMLFKVAAVDGEVAMEEQVILDYFARKIGVSDETFRQLRAKYE